MNNKRRGKNGELEAVKFWKHWGFDARRSSQYSAAGGEGEADILLPDTNLHVEVKRRKPRLSVYDFIEQATRDAKKCDIPIVMARSDDHKWLVVLWADDFAPIYTEYHCSIPDGDAVARNFRKEEEQ